MHPNKHCQSQQLLRVIVMVCCLGLIVFSARAISNPNLPINDYKLNNNPWFFQSFLAVSSDADFHDAVAGFDFEQSEERSFISGLTVGKKVGDSFLVWAFEIVAYASVQQFNERDHKPSGWGVTAYFKAYQSFNIPFTNFSLRPGFGNGLSYVSRIPCAEVRDFSPYPSEKLIYYMDYSLQASVRHLAGRGERPFSSTIDDVFVGYSIWHRSTLFGVFGESPGGINYLGLSMELSFH